MSRYLKGSGLIATLLLIVIIVVGIAMWFLDLIVQQRTFAFFLSAELLAFAMLVYLYYAETPQEIRRRWLLIGSSAIAAVILLGIAVFPGVVTTNSTPNVSISMLGGTIL